MRNATLVGIFAAFVLLLASPFLLLHVLWDREPWHAERVTLVDYSVPFENAREHAGAIWLLNHEKYPPPTGEQWEPLGSYVGYDPRDREHPTRIATQDLSETDWLYITDTYGVYEGDLAGEATQTTTNDVSRRAFGGVSELDAQTVASYVGRGGHLFAEFALLESPTGGRARAILQDLLGVRWTGWTGRVFETLADQTDVPAWFTRRYREQYGADALPTGPALVLVHMDGRMIVIPNASFRDAAPSIALTARGRQVLPTVRSGSGYLYWFPILTVDVGTELLAELTLPEMDAASARRLEQARIPTRIPLLTRRIVDGSHRVYVAADLADVSFAPRWYGFRWAADLRRILETNPRRPDHQTAFWAFYAPTFRQLLREPFDGPAAAPTPR